MQLQLEQSNCQYQIKAITDTAITINDEVYRHSVVVTANQLISPWKVNSVTDITFNDLEWLTQGPRPDILIIGCGRQFSPLSSKLIQAIDELGIGIECMENRAAVRTYVALRSENRKAALAIIF